MNWKFLSVRAPFASLMILGAITGCGGGSGLSTAGTSGPGPTILPAMIAQRTSSSLSAATLSAATASSAYATAVLADGANVYYQLNDASSVLADSGPNNVPGSYGAGIKHQVTAITTGGGSATGFAGGAAYDSTMFTTTPASASLMPATLTVEAWVRIGQYNTTEKLLPIVSYGRYANGSRYALFITQQNAAVYQQINVGKASAQLFSTSAMVPGNVYHLVATSDGHGVNFYVNGKLEASQLYYGSPDYAGTGNQGLYIGGAYQSNLPSFNGTIGQVAIYGRALSAAQVLNHFEAGQLAPMTAVAPMSSDGFVDSIGVNTHFSATESLYGTSYAQVEALLTGLGVRHIRDGYTTNGMVASEYKQLGAAGIHGLITTLLTNTEKEIQAVPSFVGSMFEAYEAPQEQDDLGNPDWLASCGPFQKSLYSWVKSDSATSHYPVLGPALVKQASYTELGNVSAYMDNANVHDYMNPYNPGTAGYGSLQPYGIYGSIDYAVNLVKVTSGNKPVIATETGYGTNIPETVDDRTFLRYIPRLFFEQINHGIVRTYSYEFLDDGGDGTEMFQTFGLVQHDLVPKYAYTALKGLISTLSDPGSSFALKPLTYQLRGNTGNVAQTLMQKRNGDYELAIWIETPSWNTVTPGDIIVPNQAVTLNTAATFAKATISTLDESGNLSTAPLSWSGTSATFNVSDKVSIVTISP